jgi:O-methyltransferase
MKFSKSMSRLRNAYDSVFLAVTTYRRFSKFTMIPEAVYVENLLLAKSVSHREGCVVECGVWRGGMIAGIAEILGPDRQYFLFDSFEGLPNAQKIDGQGALEWQANTKGIEYHDNCSAKPQYAEDAMALSGAKCFHLVKGWFSETLLTFVPPAPILLLRLDADWYDSTMTCLRALYPYVSSGGLIILDDYYTWDGCSRAVHDFLSETSSTDRIFSRNGICFIRKS